MELVVVLEEDAETGGIVALVPQLPGCHTQGRDKAEAMRNVRDAIALYLEGEDYTPARLVSVERVNLPG